MNEIIVDSKIQALEAALKLTEKRNLPVPRAAVSVEPIERPGATKEVSVRKEDLALALLWRMEGRVAEIEEKRSLDDAWQKTVDCAQNEQSEAIELISKEVAALRKQTQKMERYLSASQLEMRQRRNQASLPRFSMGLVFLVFALLGALAFFLFAIILR